MIEALAHDLGKASRARFGGDHAAASADLMKRAGFEDEAALRLIARHHKSTSGDDPDLRLLQLADRLASSHRAEGGTSAAFAFIPIAKRSLVKVSLERFDYNYLRLTEAYLVHDLSEHFSQFGDDYAAFRRFVQNCWWLELVKASTSDASNASLREHLLLTDSIYQIHLLAVDKFGFEFVDKVLKELLEVGVLGRNDEGKYNLKKSLESKRSFVEPRFGLPSDEKLRGAILEMHSVGFEIDGIAFQTGLPELHVVTMLNEQTNQK